MRRIFWLLFIGSVACVALAKPAAAILLRNLILFVIAILAAAVLVNSTVHSVAQGEPRCLAELSPALCRSL